MMTRGLFGLLLLTFSGSVSAIHQRGWTESSAMVRLKKDASAGRRTQSDSERSCNDWKSIYENLREPWTCNCEAEVDGTDTTSLNCIEECEYCNDDFTICVQRSFVSLVDENGVNIGENGDLTGLTGSFVYTKGRNEIVTFQEDFIDDSCQVFLDGQECESCTFNVCGDGNYKLSFNCTNLEADAVYDLCDDPLIIPNGSVFTFLTTEGDGYDICHLPTETPSASVAPSVSVAPSAAISNVPSLSPTMTAPPTTTTTTAPSGTPPVDDSGGGNTVGVVITVTSLIVLFATTATL